MLNKFILVVTATVILPNGKVQQRIYIPTNGRVIEQRINENLEVKTTIIMPVSKNTFQKIHVGEPTKEGKK